jgi:hypothetical protein
VMWAEMPRSPGHACLDKLQKLLNEAGFDSFALPSIHYSGNTEIEERS